MKAEKSVKVDLQKSKREMNNALEALLHGGIVRLKSTFLTNSVTLKFDKLTSSSHKDDEICHRVNSWD